MILELFLVHFAQQAPRPAPSNRPEPGARAFAWADVDGDGALEVATLDGGGTLRLLRKNGNGRFEDVTSPAGLDGVGHAGLLLWQDYDGDGRLDLFVGAKAGVSRLFHNEGAGFFLDWTGASGIAIEGEVLSAQWLDHDGDGRLDLHVATKGATQLLRGIEGGFLEPVPLPALAPSAGQEGGSATGRVGISEAEAGGAGVPRSDENARESRVRMGNGATSITVTPGAGTGGTQAFSTLCLPRIRDQANPGVCLPASSVPALGKLYPISSSWFVSPSGRVGLGTTTPVRQFHVQGGDGLLAMIEQTQDGGNAVLELKDSTPSQGSISSINFLDGNGGAEGQLAYRVDTGLMSFETCATQKMWLDCSGRLGIGTNAPSEQLTVIGNICYTGTSGVCSDERFKTNVADLEDALAKVLELRAVEFDWRRDEFPQHHFCAERQFGLIAQEVRDVVPEIVAEGADGYLSVDYGKLSPLLVEAIQTQNEELSELRRANEELNLRVARLEGIEAKLQLIEETVAALAGSK
jgi:hypothetical protein